jgi:hypothetical protein
MFLYFLLRKPFKKIFSNLGWISTERLPYWAERQMRRYRKRGLNFICDKIFYLKGRHRRYKIIVGSPKFQGDSASEEYYYKERKR